LHCWTLSSQSATGWWWAAKATWVPSNISTREPLGPCCLRTAVSQYMADSSTAPPSLPMAYATYELESGSLQLFGELLITKQSGTYYSRKCAYLVARKTWNASICAQFSQAITIHNNQFDWGLIDYHGIPRPPH
jgi:hypothetical protein